MVTDRCEDISAPGNRYPRVRKNVIPLGKCGLNVALPNRREDCRMTRQLVESRTRIVCTCVQAYNAMSRVDNRSWEEILNRVIDRILNNILRSSSVF